VIFAYGSIHWMFRNATERFGCSEPLGKSIEPLTLQSKGG
jgi:hypothetical protein